MPGRVVAQMTDRSKERHGVESNRVFLTVCRIPRYVNRTLEFQVELFHLKVSQIQQPVLDIGCGSRANLVRYLRLLGIDAYGIDRFLDTQDDYLEQADWFDYVFEPDRWGTIISNMAFTNHLTYTYHHDRMQLERYLLKMDNIIQSLGIGGSFHYAPSLPFVEQRLVPTRYKVVRKRVMDEIGVSTITRIAG